MIYSVTNVVINKTGWTTSYRIPKGSIFTVILTNSNASTATEKTVEEIYSMFEFVTDTKNVIDSTDDDITACIGTPENPSNKFQAFYPTRLTMLDYIKCDKRLLKVQSTNGYKYYFIGYDESFNVKKFNIHGGGFKTGLNYIDVSDYAYVRVVLANSTDTAVTVEDIENISIEKSVPLLLDECDNTIKSYAKDGINQERKAYAPMYPQSSIVSFQKAFDQGFRSLLLHLQFTADNKMVVLHDLIIDNSAVNSDGTAITGSIRVDSLTLAQLDQYDFGLKFGEEYRGTKITRFADALMWAKKHNVYISIEQIDSNVTNAQLDLMCNALKTYGYIRGNACYWSTKFVNVNYVHGILPDIDLSLTLGSAEAITAWAERFANLKGRSNNVIFYEYPQTLTNEVMATMAQYGIEAMTQDFNGDEPNNVVDLIDTHTYVSRVVSQIMPAKYALLT
jgi:glycerophosphoryl diester phosphodiesterase